MGSVIPTGPDGEICAALGDRFSDRRVGGKARIDHLRDQQVAGNERFFDGAHHLHRLAHRFRGIPRGQTHKLRWYAFLRSILPTQAPQTVIAINQVLDTCLADRSIQKVEFAVLHDSSINLPFELFGHPHNNSGIPETSTVGGLKVCKVTLLCRIDKELPDSPAEHDPPDNDPAGVEKPPEFPPG